MAIMDLFFPPKPVQKPAGADGVSSTAGKPVRAQVAAGPTIRK